ncbi:MAG: IclR family transcriptional regulator [Paracoccaceae bacterium]|nr:IclR family transcriptional regulator [Paracoccaceae bacterium]
MASESEASAPLRRARGRPRGWDDKTAQNTIKSLDRAMEVFEFLSTDQGQTLSEISDGTSQAAATVYRILVTLEGRGLVEFDADEQLWYIGARAFVIGARYLRRTSLVERARPILRRLMETTGETANLGIEQTGSVLFVSQVETHESIRAFFPPGTLSPMYASGIGKALLAEMDDDRVRRIFESEVPVVFTPNTITDLDRLSQELAVTRQRGFAIDAEEKNLGMRCIAAPVFDMHREAVAGLSVSGPASRMDVHGVEAISAAVRDAAADLTRAIGGEAPDRPGL